MNWYCISKEKTIKEFGSSVDNGLSNKESKKRLQQYGYNSLISKKKKGLFIKFLEQFKDFMIITLIFAAIISFTTSYIHGELDFIEPSIILLIIILNALLGVFQEAKAEKSLDSLKKMTAPTSTVLRDGKKTFIEAQELVVGDIVFLEAGNFVPADGRLLTAINLKIDESSLTGESHPVDKVADMVLPKDTLLGDRINMVMATGMVTYGRGSAIVTATGMQTEVGSIAKLILTDDTPMTPLQKRLSKTGKVLGISALFI